MNERIRELTEQSWDDAKEKFGSFVGEGGEINFDFLHAYDEKFAELVIQACVDSCRKLWYDENNHTDIPDHEDPRSVGFRSGMKAGIVKCTNEIAKLK